MGKVTIVGISGVTNGGKTFLSKKIVDQFPNSIVIRQDDFFREEDDPNHVWIVLSSGRKHQNWELLGSINWDKLKSHVDLTLKNIDTNRNEEIFLIIEGHLIFNYRDFPFDFDHKFFITLPKDECYRRRIKRNYIPADPEGFFEECIWPMYLENKKIVYQECKDIVYLDGTNDPEDIYQSVLKLITRNK